MSSLLSSLRSRVSPKVIVGATTLLAAFLRLYRLDQTPPGLQFDVAFNVFDEIRLLQGQFAIFFPANTGREPLYFYLSTVSVALFGPTGFAFKFMAALIGVATIPLIYGFARSLFQSARIGILAALLATISFWHIFFSRDGLRVILEVPLTLLMFWYAWRALVPNPERQATVSPWRNWAWCGFYLALGLYTYPSARLLPLALIFLAAIAAWRDRAHAHQYLRGLGLALGVAGLIFLPLGIYFIFHPDQFISHTLQISILASQAKSPPLQALAENALRLLGMFLFQGDSGAIRNLPGRPVFDPLVGALFVLGTGLLLVKLLRPAPWRSQSDQPRALLLGAWIAISLGSSLFSDDAPNFLRTLPALPALMILPAWGLSVLWDRWPRALPALASIVLLVSGGLTFRDYFVVFANQPGLYYAFDADKVEIANWINANANSQHIFLAPLFYQQGTISLLTRVTRLKSFDSRDSIIIPSGEARQDAVFAFPSEQEKRAQTMADRLGALGARTELRGENGDVLLWLYRIPAANLPTVLDPLQALTRGGAFVQPQQTRHAVWEDQLALLGYSVAGTGPGSRNLAVTLFLQALAPMQGDYTFSLKARDAQGRVFGQEDKFPGDNSYATSSWSPGEVVIEKFYPGLDPCAPAGDYNLTVEVYEPKTNRVLSLSDQPGNMAVLGSTHAGASAGNRLQDLEPDQAKQVHVAEGLELLGWNLSTSEFKAGDDFSLSLFWRGAGDKAASYPITIQLRDSKGHKWDLAAGAATVPQEGRGICSWYDLHVPTDVAGGNGSLRVNGVQLESIKVAGKGQ